jgi:uncharacterized protein (TIGR03435 family)
LGSALQIQQRKESVPAVKIPLEVSWRCILLEFKEIELIRRSLRGGGCEKGSFGMMSKWRSGKNVTLWLACLAAGALWSGPRASRAYAQDAQAGNTKQNLVGTWQGTLHAGQDLRTVLKVTKDEKGGYKADFYSIDQGARPLPVSSITLDGSTVNMALNMIGGKYEGKLSADGNTITGEWSQGPNPLPLVLTRATPETEWAIPKPEPPIPPMAADADPSFEVATIKPNNTGAVRLQGLVIRGRNFITRASSVEDLISFAYSVQEKQIVNAPAWIDSERYDIEAIPDAPGTPNTEQVRVMIRKLLADRFKLAFHKEKRDLPAYVLTVAKSGEKLPPTELKGQLPGLGFGPGKGGLTLRAINAAIPDFTGFLQVLVLDRPVVDRTGLTGRYDFSCTFTPDDSQFGGHPPRMPGSTPAAPGAATGEPAAQTSEATPSAPNLFEAMQQQLGLKLSAEKTAVDVIAIDHVDHPSPN